MPTLEEFRKQTVSDLEALGIKAPTKEDLVTTSLEGIDFGASSLIAHWSVGRYFRVQTPEDYAMYNQDVEPTEQLPAPDLSPVHPGDNYHLFYRDQSVANRVHVALNGEDNNFMPKLNWVFTAPSATVKNTPDISKFVEGFGDQVTYWVRVQALEKGHKRNAFGNRKSRHEYSFIALPPTVQAIAELYGYTVPEYDLSPLTAPGAADEFDDEFFAEHMGPSDGDFAGTFYAKQREALWKALGEDDLRKTSMKGSVYFDRKGREHPDPLATESEKLSKCLVLAQTNMTVWARLLRVPNPGGSGFSVPTITEIFMNEDHATMEAQAELAERGTGGGGGAATPSHPPAIGGWAGSEPSDVINYLTQNKIVPLSDEVLAVAPPPKRDAQHAARMELVSASYLCADEQNPTDGEWDVLVEWDTYIREQA